MTVDGNVGIGTNNPGAKLEVVANTSTAFNNGDVTSSIEIEGTGGQTPSIAFHRSGVHAFKIGQDLNGNFAIGGWSRSGSQFVVDGNGRVGIGTNTPAVALDTVGAIRASGGSLFNGTNGYLFSGVGDTDGGMFSPADGTLVFATNNTEKVRIDPWGNVGIGTANPIQKMEVV